MPPHQGRSPEPESADLMKDSIVPSIIGDFLVPFVVASHTSLSRADGHLAAVLS